MAIPTWLIVALATALALYLAAILILIVLGRRTEARALAGFIPDCIVLFRRLLADSRVPRGRKFALVLLIAYLALPIDVVPDFIPLAGQLDDAILAALVLRFVLRGASPQMLVEHWPGPPGGLRVLVRIAFPSQASADPARARRSRRFASPPSGSALTRLTDWRFRGRARARGSRQRARQRRSARRALLAPSLPAGGYPASRSRTW